MSVPRIPPLSSLQKVSLGTLGITDQNSTFVNCGLGSGADEVKNRTLDAIHGFTGVPISGLAELADTVPCHLFKYTDSESSAPSSARTRSTIWIKIRLELIKARTKISQPSGSRPSLCVRADLDEDLVYEITSILYENRDRLKDLHPPLSYTASPGSCSTISRSNCMPEQSVL